jgi:hypothetical protein
MWRGEQAVNTRAPNQAYGYYAGYGPENAGSGSGMGKKVAGLSQLAAGQGVTVGNQDWHPTILYLIALVVVEMVVFGYVAKVLK